MKLIRYQVPEGWDYSPLAHLATLQQEIHRAIRGSGFGVPRESSLETAWTPALDLIEEKENLVVRAELPGLKKEAIEITVHDGVLTLSGERVAEGESNDGEVLRSERFHGKFERSIALPKSVNVEKATATHTNGVLTIKLPKTEEAKPKQIHVNFNN